MPENAVTSPAISVCILTANRDELLRPMLAELLNQLEANDEIVVLDTAGSDQTQQVIADLKSPQVRYHAFKMAQFNFAAARNELIRLASCEAVAFIDDDAFPFPDWLSQVREGLRSNTAVGGITLADGLLPDRWHEGINWCVGLSPAGTALGVPGYYPDTCNMAARREAWLAHPFQVVERGEQQLYVTGREDAEWWKSRRLAGERVVINSRQAVLHHVHGDRLTMKYIRQRAYNDGVASWIRRPDYEAATDIPWDLAHVIAVVFDKCFRRPRDRSGRLPDVVWMHRQWGKYRAVWSDLENPRPRRREQATQLGKALVFQGKIRAGDVIFKGINLLRHRGEFPHPSPRSIFVSADCFLGDSLLLRRHVKALADTFPESRILQSCRYPELMTGLGDNIDVQPTEQAAMAVRSGFRPDAAIVPYYAFGDYKLWREILSPVAATFDSDVSFPGRRDYRYARMQIPKNYEVHEHENLARLFSQWDLRESALPPPPAIPGDAVEQIRTALHETAIHEKYIVVQFGAGRDFKEWPLDCWIPFLKRLSTGVDLPIVITGGGNWLEAADIAITEVKHEPGMINLCGCSIMSMAALIRDAVLFIGACSGPKHIAMTYDVPTFTMYSATEPYRWGATENHHLHDYVDALHQKLSGMELQGLSTHHRPRLLDPETTAERALGHYHAIRHREL